MKDDLFHNVNGSYTDKSRLRPGLGGQVVDVLRDEILSGKLPTGSRLHETDISERLGISRGPVRDALRALQTEGLLKMDWHKGAFVKTLTLNDVIEVYTLRSALEQLAVDRAITFRTEHDLELLRLRAEDIEDARYSKDDADMLLADIAFHQQIYASAHHERLFHAWTSLRSQIAFVLLQRRETTDEYKDLMVREHWDLYEVIRTQNRDRAIDMIHEHVTSAFERLRNKLYPLTEDAGAGTATISMVTERQGIGKP